jgi:hypothetical protein
MGIAYPKGTRSDGLKVGSSRHCLLSTGVMNEVITDLVPNQLFRFRILNTPPTMHEWNPFFQIDTRHLSGYMHCRYGEFRLRALPGGKTELTGLSEYDQEIYPALYWFLWSDSVVEQVHQRAMGGIKAAAESRP